MNTPQSTDSITLTFRVHVISDPAMVSTQSNTQSFDSVTYTWDGSLAEGDWVASSGSPTGMEVVSYASPVQIASFSLLILCLAAGIIIWAYWPNVRAKMAQYVS